MFVYLIMEIQIEIVLIVNLILRIMDQNVATVHGMSMALIVQP